MKNNVIPKPFADKRRRSGGTGFGEYALSVVVVNNGVVDYSPLFGLNSLSDLFLCQIEVALELVSDALVRNRSSSYAFHGWRIGQARVWVRLICSTIGGGEDRAQRVDESFEEAHVWENK